jgi:cell fate regulator YaaT (PSP1 superfamily)
MKKIVEIKFKPDGKAYIFDCGAFVLESGDYVIVETEQGYGMGCVTGPPVRIDMENLKRPLKKVHRKAVDKDFKLLEENRALEDKGLNFCLEQIRSLGLEMNLFSVESSFDARKLTFFYTADGRVDFRQLVKRLVGHFRIKIEMRQVGIRNQAKITGGIGRCGREICCAGFLNKFDPISIKMAKNQGLSLNPTKISGVCGRLMCCLAFEEETYGKNKKNDRRKKNPPQPTRPEQSTTQNVPEADGAEESSPARQEEQPEAALNLKPDSATNQLSKNPLIQPPEQSAEKDGPDEAEALSQAPVDDPGT